MPSATRRGDRPSAVSITRSSALVTSTKASRSPSGAKVRKRRCQVGTVVTLRPGMVFSAPMKISPTKTCAIGSPASSTGPAASAACSPSESPAGSPPLGSPGRTVEESAGLNWFTMLVKSSVHSPNWSWGAHCSTW